MVPPSSHRVPRVRRYSGSCRLPCRFAYGILTLFDRPSHAVPLQLRIPSAVQTPRIFLPAVWPLPLSLATTYGISVDFSSSPYLDVSVQEVPLIYLCIQYMIYELLSYGLLHSDICGSLFAYNSPQLFAVNHVLLRFPMPRHPPCALISFTICPF